MSGGYLTDSVDVYYRPKTEYTGRRMFLKKRKSYEYKGEEESHEHTGMERMKELINMSYLLQTLPFLADHCILFGY